MPEGMDRLKLLLRAGARPSARDVQGETLLHKALLHGVSACGGPAPHPAHTRCGPLPASPATASKHGGCAFLLAISNNPHTPVHTLCMLNVSVTQVAGF